jgi:hypothetical protein
MERCAALGLSLTPQTRLLYFFYFLLPVNVKWSTLFCWIWCACSLSSDPNPYVCLCTSWAPPTPLIKSPIHFNCSLLTLLSFIFFFPAEAWHWQPAKYIWKLKVKYCTNITISLAVMCLVIKCEDNIFQTKIIRITVKCMMGSSHRHIISPCFSLKWTRIIFIVIWIQM